MSDRVPPHDLEAEESLLGSMMMSKSAILAVNDRGVRPSDFYKPSHQRIYAAVMELWNDGESVDVVTLAAKIKATSNGNTPIDRRALAEIEARTPVSAHASGYAKVVTDLGSKRLLLGGMGNAADACYDPTASASDVLGMAEDAIRDAELPELGGVESQDVESWIDAVEDPAPYIIPGTLRKRERLMILASPGEGKSTLTRQWGLQVSQGIHPWLMPTFAPARVLMIDCENEPSGVREEMVPLVEHARDVMGQSFDPGRFRVEFRIEGMDLLNRADSLWLSNRVAANKPDLLIIGPLYLLHDVDDNDAHASKRVLMVLNGIRRRYGCALMVETHPPKECWPNRGASRVPLHVGGSRVWTNWPEFIGGLTVESNGRTATWDQVRPPRYRKRDWPGRLKRDGRRWPWESEEYGR